eukprot:TRINITY_DN18803_c1_g1_i1.p1 TRINITY_DN18803_c1_g1~~TRINITY_DN18803_c1_g1_i1.p1  ORF type:complete len:556 (-),score=75.60 TRINITY_DN18803_c1_g1_i1:256-1923(-)
MVEATCPHCGEVFVGTAGRLFGTSAVTQRDLHTPVCSKNPKNKCFCGVVFPNVAARDLHAPTCESNPANRFRCPHCPLEFVTAVGTLGLFATDGKCLRDAHAVLCNANPKNICFCGQVFSNADARNSHAVQCDKNPANCFECQFCNARFVTTFGVLGFRGSDGRAVRDAHQASCNKNPSNRCFCGAVFPCAAARDGHAATCEANPANRFECAHCNRLFVTRHRLMGLVASDGKSLRDAHAERCEKNPLLRCFCDQLFLNVDARDVHASKCEMNPANRFNCKYCSSVFVTTFGLFTKCGSAERDAHALICKSNPSNVTCQHCSMTFVESERGSKSWWRVDAQKRCSVHSAACQLNPQNRFDCQKCGACFVTRPGWFGKADGWKARNLHQESCDVIPVEFEESDAGFGAWTLVSPCGIEDVVASESPSSSQHDMCELCGLDSIVNEPARDCVSSGLEGDMKHLTADDFFDVESVDEALDSDTDDGLSLEPEKDRAILSRTTSSSLSSLVVFDFPSAGGHQGLSGDACATAASLSSGDEADGGNVRETRSPLYPLQST